MTCLIPTSFEFAGLVEGQAPGCPESSQSTSPFNRTLLSPTYFGFRTFFDVDLTNMVSALFSKITRMDPVSTTMKIFLCCPRDAFWCRGHGCFPPARGCGVLANLRVSVPLNQLGAPRCPPRSFQFLTPFFPSYLLQGIPPPSAIQFLFCPTSGPSEACSVNLRI